MPLREKRLSLKDIAQILWVSSRSFKNVKIPFAFFENLMESDLRKFKDQLETVIQNEEERSTHRGEISKIFYSLQNEGAAFKFDHKAFYYFFKMNSSFEFWGMFDYETFKQRCKNLK